MNKNRENSSSETRSQTIRHRIPMQRTFTQLLRFKTLSIKRVKKRRHNRILSMDDMNRMTKQKRNSVPMNKTFSAGEFTISSQEPSSGTDILTDYLMECIVKIKRKTATKRMGFFVELIQRNRSIAETNATNAYKKYVEMDSQMRRGIFWTQTVKSKATERTLKEEEPKAERRLTRSQSKPKPNLNAIIDYYIKQNTDPMYITVSDVPPKGKGIVAKEAILKNQFICEYTGHLTDKKAAQSKELEYNASGLGPIFLFYFKYNEKRHCIDSTEDSGRYGRLMNHSRRQPNCKPVVYECNGDPHLVFTALRDIQPNEEVLYDYGERNRMVIRDNQWLSKS